MSDHGEDTVIGSRHHLRGLGAVALLEEKLRGFYGMRYALCMSSATMALHGLALALDLNGVDFVTTPLTYGATVAGWLMQRSRPVFADVERDTLTLDPAAAARMITRRTRALLAVDLFGNPCDDEALRRVADEHGIWYVADAAQSFGATRNGRPASSVAHAVVVSFTAGKALDAGEGGAVMTNHSEIYERLIWFTQHPERQQRELGAGTWNEFGLNGRIHPAAAHLANCRFDVALGTVRARQERAFNLIEAINSTGLTDPVRYPLQVRPSFFRLVARLAPGVDPSTLGAALENAEWPGMVRRVCLSPLYRDSALRAANGPPDSATRCCAAEETRNRLVQVDPGRP
jgi:dTDP-4-amino-4,6-dideoxygalactose transaminase